MHRVFGMVSTQPSLDYTAAALATFFRHAPLGPQNQFYLIDNDRSINPAAFQHAVPHDMAACPEVLKKALGEME
jgi:hypothetical protein